MAVSLFYAFKFESLPQCVSLFISYRAVNTFHFGCENRSLNVIMTVWSEVQTKPTRAVRMERRIF